MAVQPESNLLQDLNHAEMDRQHRQLLASIEQAVANPDGSQGVRSLFEALVSHFRWEEELMAEVGYPDRLRHLADHQRELWALAESSKLQGEGAFQRQREVLRSCERWTLRHVESLDGDFAEYLLDRELWDLRREVQIMGFEDRFQGVEA